MLDDALASTLALAVFAGLVVGKLLGIAGAPLLALRARLGRAAGGRAARASWSGWPRSAGSASRSRCSSPSSRSTDEALVDEAKVGIFAGSIVSGVLGAALLARRGAR